LRENVSAFKTFWEIANATSVRTVTVQADTLQVSSVRAPAPFFLHGWELPPPGTAASEADVLMRSVAIRAIIREKLLRALDEVDRLCGYVEGRARRGLSGTPSA
jgi:hypothetical protein